MDWTGVLDAEISFVGGVFFDISGFPAPDPVATGIINFLDPGAPFDCSTGICDAP